MLLIISGFDEVQKIPRGKIMLETQNDIAETIEKFFSV